MITKVASLQHRPSLKHVTLQAYRAFRATRGSLNEQSIVINRVNV